MKENVIEGGPPKKKVFQFSESPLVDSKDVSIYLDKGSHPRYTSVKIKRFISKEQR
jgi:hypothetical protein